VVSRGSYIAAHLADDPEHALRACADRRSSLRRRINCGEICRGLEASGHRKRVRDDYPGPRIGLRFGANERNCLPQQFGEVTFAKEPVSIVETDCHW
jgi:hypothetical protein